MNYLILLLVAFAVCLAAVPVVKRLAALVGAIDVPNQARKIHKKPIPLLGGLAVYVAFAVAVIFYLLVYKPDLYVVPLRFYFAMIGGGAVLMIGGFLDDKFNLPPRYSFIAPVIATLIIIFSGIGVGIHQLSNPFGGNPISLNFNVLGISFSAIFVFFFMMGMIYTTKFLDGMDGLCSGISVIASLALFGLSFTPKVNQPITASIAIMFAGACLGFLIYNFNPASIFLGESGSTFLGFMLGVMSVLLGGKIATAILVMGIPIMDVAWVIVRRIWFGGSPFQADRKHLHLRLLDIGYSQKQTALILYTIAAIFGCVAVFLQSMGKLIALAILVILMVALGIFTVVVYKKKTSS